MARRPLLLTASALLALVAVGLAVVLLTGAESQGIAATVRPAVQTADGSAGCVARPDLTLVCANRVSQGRQVPVALIAGGTTSPKAVDARVDWSDGTRLAVGEERDVRGFHCSATRAGLVCAAPGGDALAVSATHLSATVAGADYP